MWGNKKIRSSKIDTLIGQSIELDGDLNFSGGLHLDGKINGNVSSENGSQSVLVVSEQGVISGDVSVPYAVINGTIKGNVYASEKLELSNKACITGNVHYNVLEMASGASVNGNMLHENKERHLLEHHARPVESHEQPEVSISEEVMAKG
ncbi:MAG: polymer-forming cytoskeletal protein [Thiotrichales bacterium]|nr:MAG: polymer-forming cytoskeletal protein [Thiotrichales bacterium]